MSTRRGDPQALVDLPLERQLGRITWALRRRDDAAGASTREWVTAGALAGLAALLFPLQWAPRLALATAVGVVAGLIWDQSSRRTREAATDADDAQIAGMVSLIRDPDAIEWLLDHAAWGGPKTKAAMWDRIDALVHTRRDPGADLPWLLGRLGRTPWQVSDAAWETIADMAPAAGAAIIEHTRPEDLDWIAGEMVRQLNRNPVPLSILQERVAALARLLADAGYVPALPKLDDLARSWRPEAVRIAAQAAAAHLRETEERRKRTDRLLRPADAPTSETLLRPSEPVSPEHLLRPAEADTE